MGPIRKRRRLVQPATQLRLRLEGKKIQQLEVFQRGDRAELYAEI